MLNVFAISYKYVGIAADFYLVIDQSSRLIDDVQRIQRRHSNSMPIKLVKVPSLVPCTTETTSGLYSAESVGGGVPEIVIFC